MSRYCVLLILLSFFCCSCKENVQELSSSERGVVFFDLPFGLLQDKKTELLKAGQVIVLPWQRLQKVNIAERTQLFYLDEYGVSYRDSEIKKPLGIVSVTYKIDDSYDGVINYLTAFGESSDERFLEYVAVLVRHASNTINFDEFVNKSNQGVEIQSFFEKTLNAALGQHGVIIEGVTVDSYYDKSAIAEEKKLLRELKPQIKKLEGDILDLQERFEEEIFLEKKTAERNIESANQRARRIKQKSDVEYRAKLERAKQIRAIGKEKNQSLQRLVDFIHSDKR